jgi:hypothetical protein
MTCEVFLLQDFGKRGVWQEFWQAQVTSSCESCGFWQGNFAADYQECLVRTVTNTWDTASGRSTSRASSATPATFRIRWRHASGFPARLGRRPDFDLSFPRGNFSGGGWTASIWRVARNAFGCATVTRGEFGRYSDQAVRLRESG